MLATCSASSPSDIDFACGFHDKLVGRHPLEHTSRGRSLVIDFLDKRVSHSHNQSSSGK